MAAPQLQPTELEWVRPPRQARSHLTLGRILDAAEALLREKRWEDASVAEIARRAGSSVGAFYSRFRDKDALLSALHERFVEEAIATAELAMNEQRWANASICEIVRELVAFQVRLQDQHAGLWRAIALRATQEPERNTSTLEPILEHLRYRDGGQRRLAKLAVANRRWKHGRFGLNRPRFVHQREPWRVREPGEIAGGRRQTDADKTDVVVRQRTRRSDRHHLRWGVRRVHARTPS